MLLVMATLTASHSKNTMHWVAGILGLAVLITGITQVTHSSLFLLRSVSVTPLSSSYPLTREKVLELARIPVGNISLFDLSLEPIQSRLIEQPWVKGVVLGKQFPSQLSLTIIERNPVALLTEPQGRVVYLEADGTTFEDKAMTYPEDLPILEGFSAQNIESLKEANAFIRTWFAPDHFPGLKVSSLSNDEKMGLRAVVSVPESHQKQMRVVIELGLNLREAAQVSPEHLSKVLKYLSDHSMQASKIWLGDGKKIVVKVLKGP